MNYQRPLNLAFFSWRSIDEAQQLGTSAVVAFI
jgi:hypothetical protein